MSTIAYTKKTFSQKQIMQLMSNCSSAIHRRFFRLSESWIFSFFYSSLFYLQNFNVHPFNFFSFLLSASNSTRLRDEVSSGYLLVKTWNPRPLASSRMALCYLHIRWPLLTAYWMTSGVPDAISRTSAAPSRDPHHFYIVLSSTEGLNFFASR